jgi:hypothetical protein
MQNLMKSVFKGQEISLSINVNNKVKIIRARGSLYKLKVCVNFVAKLEEKEK